MNHRYMYYQGLARIIPLLSILLIGQCLFAAPPPVLRNSWSTNTAGTPVRGVDNLSVTNAGSGTNWTFFGISPQTVARLTDVSNIVTSGSFIEDFNGFGTNTTFITAFTNLDNWVSSTGVLDTAIGVNVQPLGGDAKRNTFIGQEIAVTFQLNSGNDLTNSDNVAVGANNFRNLNGGYRNVAIGSTALQEAVDTVADIGIGYRALTSIKTGGSTIGIGDGTMLNATNLFGSIAIGIEAGLNITNHANYVTMVGHHAGYGTLTQAGSPGEGSTWIGADAGGELRTNVSHSTTTAIGYRAGLYGGSNCTYIGAHAGRYNTNDGTRLIIDGLDRSTYQNEKDQSIIYGVMNGNPALQKLNFNVGSAAVGTLGVAAPLAGVTFDINGTNLIRGPVSINQSVLPVSNSALDVNGFAVLRGANGALSVQGDYNLATGAGWEIKYSGGIGYFDAFDRSGGAWRPGVFRGSTFQVNGNGGTAAIMVNALGAVAMPLAVTMGGSVTVTNSLSVSNLLVGVNNAASITNILAASATLDFPSTSVGAVADLRIAVTGAESGDVVSVGSPPGSTTTIIGSYSGFASNASVFVRFTPTAATQDPASGTFKVLVTKF